MNPLKANNVKYLVNDIPLHRWCKQNHYSYPAAYQMIRRGISINRMKSLIQNKYVGKDESIFLLLVDYAKEYPSAERHRRLEIRKHIMMYKELDRHFEDVVLGNVDKLKKIINQKKIDSEEVWLPIPDDQRYECSNFGRFRKHLLDGSIKNIQAFRKGQANKEGIISRYNLFVTINQRTRFASRIIAEVHVPKPSPKHTRVQLIDNSDFRNINSNNLKWITPWMHGHLTGHSVKTSLPVELLSEHGDIEEKFPSIREAAKELGISYTSVIEICKGRTKKPKFNLRYGIRDPLYIPTWGYGGGKKRIEVQS